jgi:hypothetical protein
MEEKSKPYLIFRRKKSEEKQNLFSQDNQIKEKEKQNKNLKEEELTAQEKKKQFSPNLFSFHEEEKKNLDYIYSQIEESDSMDESMEDLYFLMKILKILNYKKIILLMGFIFIKILKISTFLILWMIKIINLKKKFRVF